MIIFFKQLYSLTTMINNNFKKFFYLFFQLILKPRIGFSFLALAYKLKIIDFNDDLYSSNNNSSSTR